MPMDLQPLVMPPQPIPNPHVIDWSKAPLVDYNNYLVDQNKVKLSDQAVTLGQQSIAGNEQASQMNELKIQAIKDNELKQSYGTLVTVIDDMMKAGNIKGAEEIVNNDAFQHMHQVVTKSSTRFPSPRETYKAQQEQQQIDDSRKIQFNAANTVESQKQLIDQKVLPLAGEINKLSNFIPQKIQGMGYSLIDSENVEDKLTTLHPDEPKINDAAAWKEYLTLHPERSNDYAAIYGATQVDTVKLTEYAEKQGLMTARLKEIIDNSHDSPADMKKLIETGIAEPFIKTLPTYGEPEGPDYQDKILKRSIAEQEFRDQQRIEAENRKQAYVKVQNAIKEQNESEGLMTAFTSGMSPVKPNGFTIAVAGAKNDSLEKGLERVVKMIESYNASAPNEKIAQTRGEEGNYFRTVPIVLDSNYGLLLSPDQSKAFQNDITKGVFKYSTGDLKQAVINRLNSYVTMSEKNRTKSLARLQNSQGNATINSDGTTGELRMSPYYLLLISALRKSDSATGYGDINKYSEYFLKSINGAK